MITPAVVTELELERYEVEVVHVSARPMYPR